ncbi:hypothetical protein DV515_00001363 [Chloebia gouldiae]|uniref:Uncharacterized protein n=1 Tax=Chloebia gouldiae TaxID=44316 RepID=A0A3L8SZG9_CHLGU|nr:hypothetical protein DV515_00001363 [Chloebia gouldiae]
MHPPSQLRAETSNTSFVAHDYSSREAKIYGPFPLQFERTCVEEVSITDKKGKEGKGKKNLSEELKEKLESVLVGPSHEVQL